MNTVKKLAILQNFPGFLWWKDFRRETLPVRIRVGNTWRVKPGLFMSVEEEKRYYHEGSHPQDFIYVGLESIASKRMILRGGVFSEGNITHPDRRHWTGGVSFLINSNINLSYAFESFDINDERIRRSIISVLIPFVMNER